ncbi:permease [Halorussus amylolyticus]|uniref:permease n=1 Tax=Halorussus amylolyticus TaxID=1126242 RepID=UPI00104DA4EB|nr:permease [Halorussus amylolyticus]
MTARTIALGAGTAITTFLLAGAATIELLGPGEAPAIGIIGVFVGVVVGLLAGGIASVYADRLSGIATSVLVAYATFGVAFVTIAGMSYVNVPYADGVFTFPVHIGVSIVVAVIVALLAIRGKIGEGSSIA